MDHGEVDTETENVVRAAPCTSVRTKHRHNNVHMIWIFVAPMR